MGHERRGRRHIVVTADDFGLALAVNEAVELGYTHGILRAASLMVGAPAAADAVARARRLARLRVGLHVVVVDGRPVLPPDEVPDLVDAAGAFDVRLMRSGVRFFFVPRVRRQLRAEIRAQFEAFRASGLALDHVNAHRHLHLHPTVLSFILEIGRDYGLRAVRVPFESLRAAWRLGGNAETGRARPLGRALVAAPWARLLRWRLRRAGLHGNDCVFGLSTSGAMKEATVLRILERLPDGLVELYFHPATAAHPSVALPLAAERHEAELQALTSPRVRAALEAADLRPGGFCDAIEPWRRPAHTAH